MPAVILDKTVIAAQVCGQRAAAVRAMRDKLGRHTQVLLLAHHGTDEGFIVVGFLATGFAALEQPVVALGVKQAALVKACFLEAVVHVGGQHKIVLIPHHVQQVSVHEPGWVGVAVQQNIAAPERPKFLGRFVGVKAAGVHIAEAVLRGKIGKMLVKARAAVGKTRRGRQPRPSPDDDGIGLLQGGAQLFNDRGGRRRFRGRSL